MWDAYAHIQKYRLADFIQGIIDLWNLIQKLSLAVLDIVLQEHIGFGLGDTTVIKITTDTDSQLTCCAAVGLKPQTFVSKQLFFDAFQ